MPGKEITDTGKLIAKQVSAELASGNCRPDQAKRERPNTLSHTHTQRDTHAKQTYTHVRNTHTQTLQHAFLQQRGKNPDPQQWQWTGRGNVGGDIVRVALS